MKRSGNGRTGYRKVMPSVSELRSRPSVTIAEAMHLTGYGRHRVVKLCDELLWRSFLVGKIRRIVTASILECEERRDAGNLSDAS